MTFTQKQLGAAHTGTISGGVTTLVLDVPAGATAESLLLAFLTTTAGGQPFKCKAITYAASGGNPYPGLTGNTSPGWRHVGTAVTGANQQTEMWMYANAPAGLVSTTWTNDGGQNCQGHMVEWSTTSRWQRFELFPMAASGTTGGFGTISSSAKVPKNALAVLAGAAAFASAPGGTWQVPTGGSNTPAWTKMRNVNTGSTPWGTWYAVTNAAGVVSATGSYSATSGQSAWTGVLAVFTEHDALKDTVGCSIWASSYSDQATVNPAQAYPSTDYGSAQEFDYFVGRDLAVTAAVVYQSKPGTGWPPDDSGIQHIPSPPSGNLWGDITNRWNHGQQMTFSARERRDYICLGTAAQKASEIAACEQDVVMIKQAGITGWICCYWNEMQIDGTKWFPDQATWNTYWQAIWPVYAEHGIPIFTKPSEASPGIAASWTPPAGQVSGILTDYYFDAANGVHNARLDVGASGNPALQDVADGIVNPDGTTTGCPHPPIPMGIGETGRSGGGGTPDWHEVAGWSANGTWNDPYPSGTTKTANGIRKFFKQRIADGKMNGPILWFDSGNGGSNWVHIPGANGEDDTPVTAELAAWVDDLAYTPSSGSTSGPAISTTGLPTGKAGSSYTATLKATGGTGPYTWSLDPSSAALPSWATLASGSTSPWNGTISGTPNAAADTTGLVFRVTDANGLTDTATLDLSISAASTALAVTATALPSGTSGAAYPGSGVLTATGGTGPYMWSLDPSSAALPSWATLTSDATSPWNGTISGTPPDGTDTTGLVFRVKDSTGATALSPPMGISISGPIVTTAGLAPAQAGVPYRFTLGVSGGTPGYTWASAGAALPSWAALDPAGLITGTPSAAATVSGLQFKVTDAAGATALSPLLTLTVTAAGVQITTTSLPAATLYKLYSFILQAAGGTGPYTWALTPDSGALPSGLTLGPTGLLGGIPADIPATIDPSGEPGAGLASLNIQVTDETGATATAVLTLTVDPPPAGQCAFRVIDPATGTWVTPALHSLVSGAWKEDTYYTLSAGQSTWE